jgi:hypothetical protein
MGITVAVTGPTGEIGVSAVTALEREPAVEKYRRDGTPAIRAADAGLGENQLPTGRHPGSRRGRRAGRAGRCGDPPPVPPGAYNIAGDGEVTIADVARALGGRPVRVPATAASAASAAISRLPFVPSVVEWLHVARTSVVMDTGKARRQLGWRPTHSSAETLAALAQAV